MIDEERIRSEAEGFVMLGLYEEAMELVEGLPMEVRSTPSVLRIRLACVMAAKRFDLAQEIARLLAAGSKTDAQFAARVLHELAAIHYLSGKANLAKDVIATAIAAYPEERQSFLDDPHLKHLF
ncbi:MAG: hypothetical protein EOP83_00200 [Verrucomicrobiaceae bacterium]|nr:MAG: hypothetical protein EOP83_00200 [Verrucomicrobiaceae bacterium]